MRYILQAFAQQRYIMLPIVAWPVQARFPLQKDASGPHQEGFSVTVLKQSSLPSPIMGGGVCALQWGLKSGSNSSLNPQYWTRHPAPPPTGTWSLTGPISPNLQHISFIHFPNMGSSLHPQVWGVVPTPKDGISGIPNNGNFISSVLWKLHTMYIYKNLIPSPNTEISKHPVPT